MHHFSWIKLLLVLLPISKKKWNERMSQHQSEEFYSRLASQRWASWCDWSQAIKSCGGPHKLAPQPSHYSIHYSIFSQSHKLAPRSTHNTIQGYTIHHTLYFLTATSWHEPQVLLRHPQVSTHSQVLAPLLLLISLIFCGIFFWTRGTDPIYFQCRRSCVQNCKHA